MIEQAVADLLWVTNSPSFVCGDGVANRSPLMADQVDAQALGEFLGHRQLHRVGHYFEQLVHFWLAHVRNLEVVGNGIQIKDGKRTIGEIDFIFRDERGVVTHWEAAVKFFLHHPRRSASHYPGPNATDNFEHKTKKLFEQQLELSREHFPEVELRQAFVCGQVFYHHAVERPKRLPARMAPDHLQGSWIRSTEVSRLGFHSERLGAIVRKPHWLAPQIDVELSTARDLMIQIDSHFRERDHPLMVSMRSPHDLSEIERIFVVAPNWCDSTNAT